MPFNNKRNSRDDKSGKPRRSAPHSSASRKSYRDDNSPRYGQRSPEGKPPYPSQSDKPHRGSPKWRDEGPTGNRFGDRDGNRFSADRRHRDDRPRQGSDNRDKPGNRRFGDDRPRQGSDNRDKPGSRRFGDDRPRQGSDNRDKPGN